MSKLEKLFALRRKINYEFYMNEGCTSEYIEQLQEEYKKLKESKK